MTSLWPLIISGYSLCVVIVVHITSVPVGGSALGPGRRCWGGSSRRLSSAPCWTAPGPSCSAAWSPTAQTLRARRVQLCLYLFIFQSRNKHHTNYHYGCREQTVKMVKIKGKNYGLLLLLLLVLSLSSWSVLRLCSCHRSASVMFCPRWYLTKKTHLSAFFVVSCRLGFRVSGCWAGWWWARGCQPFEFCPFSAARNTAAPSTCGWRRETWVTPAAPAHFYTWTADEIQFFF